MLQVLYSLQEVSVAAIFLIPFLLCCRKRYGLEVLRTGLYFLFCLYLSGIYVIVGLPTVVYMRYDLNINLYPFVSMLSDYVNCLRNVALFVPLGLFLPLLWKNFQKWKPTLLFGCMLSVSIELLQIFTFRATDINDLITNTLGTVLGYFAARALLPFFPKACTDSSKPMLPILLIGAFVVMFFLQPVIMLAVWGSY